GSVYSQAVDELCLEGETGWRFKPDEPREVLAAIDRALNAPVERLQRMRVAGRARVESLTPDYVAGQFVEAIDACGRERCSP
ncbi:MAG TPA: hypothetical protein VGX76_08910, partial [Pirellulales bacterium]|nr:hypothetical protein [Pirellulales bacterium]